MVLGELQSFRADLARLREESAKDSESTTDNANICGIIEKGVHLKGEQALAWLESRHKVTHRKRR